MKKYLEKGLSQLEKANAFFTQRGDEAEVPIDISDLPLEEAVVKLQNQNQAVLAKNRQLKASSDKHFEENTLLKQQLMDLRTYVKEVEQERANMQDRFHRTQIQHKQSLEQLQQECDNLAAQMKDSQGENHALQGEVTDLRFKLMVGSSSEAAGVPENTFQEWQAQKERMQEQLQVAQEKYQEILRREQEAKESASAPGDTDLDMAKLRAVEAELEDSKSQVSQLTERCEDLQKQVESLQAETPGLTAVTTATSHGAQQQPGFGWSESNPAGGDGWGDVDGSFGAWDDEQAAEQQQQQSTPLSGLQKDQGGQSHDGPGTTVPVEASAVTSALRALLDQGRATGVAPVVVTDVIALLSEYDVATCSIDNTNERCVDPFRMIAGDKPEGGEEASNAISDNVALGAHCEAQTQEPSEEGGTSLIESSAAKQLSIALSPVHTNVPSVCSDAQGVKGTSTEPQPSPGTAELFDAAGIAAGSSGTPLHAASDATTSKLQVPLIGWENFSATELGRYLQILSAVTCAVSNDRKANGHLLQAHSSTGESAAELSTTASLQARVRVAEDTLVNLCSEVSQAHMYATRSSQRSTLSTTIGPSGMPVRHLSGDMATAPDTPVSDVGSPAVPSMTTLNKILHELLSEHQALLQCTGDSSSAASKHRRTLQKLAKDAESELHRLQALQSQQQDEVSIQWTEKQQLQSAAQHEIATARQELAVRQQENEMLRAQLEELESAHEQITCERDELHQQVETHTQMLSSPAALQNLATVQMMPRLDLGSDSTLTPHSNHQSTPTPHAAAADGEAAEGNDVGAATPTEELSEIPRNSAGAAADGEARPRPEIPPLVSESNAAATLHQAHRLGIDLRAARAQCDAATKSAQEANQRAEMLQGQLADVTAERDDLLAGIDQIEEVASARIQQDEATAERLMIAEGQLVERIEELQAARAQCTAQEEQLAELRTSMAELKECVESARQRALQQEAELEELRSHACSRLLSNNGTAAVSAIDTPVKSDGGEGLEAVDALDAGEAERSSEDVAHKDDQEAQKLRVDLEEAQTAAAEAQSKHNEVFKLLEAEKQSLEDAEARCESHQLEVAAVREQLGSMEQSAEALKVELAAAKEELSATKDDLQASRDENGLLQEAMEGAQRKLEGLEQAAAEAQGKLEAAEEAAAQLRQEKTAAEEQLQEASAGSEFSQAQLMRAVEASKTAETALEEQRLQHIADVEDMKAQAADQLKSGTMELQKALKNAQAQLQAVGADKAAATEKAMQDVAALKQELLAREQQLESTQSSMAELQNSTEKQVQALQVKIDSMDAAAKKEVGKLQSELENASKKVENLQKVNKEKRRELEQLHLQHGTVQSGAAAAEVKIEITTRDLADANRRIRELEKEAKRQESAVQESNSLKSLLSKAPGAAEEGSVTAQMETLVAKAQTAARLTEEMKTLQDSAQEGVQLRSEVSSLNSRAAEDAAATKRLQQELAQTISDLTAAQDQLQVYRLELQRVQAQAKKDRVRYDTEMSRSDGFLDSLSPSDLAQWPEPVKALVASQVAAAVEDARSVLQREAEAAVESLEEQLVSFQQQLAESKSMVATLSERLSAAQEHSQHLETELKGQEVAMQAQISDLQTQLQRESATKSLDSGADAERRSWQDKCSELTIQVSELRQKLQATRAQAMLVLKEKQDAIPIRNAFGGSQSVSSPVEPSSRAASLQEVLPLSTPPEEMDNLVTAQSLPNNTDHEGITDYWKRRCTDLQKEVGLLQNDLADQMHVHELRDMADGAKAKEIQELQAVKSRSSVDIEYLKNIMIGFFEAGQLPHNEQVLVVLDRLLSFTPRDRSRIWKQQRQSDKGIVASLFGA